MARPKAELIKEREELFKKLVECKDKPSVFSDLFLDHQVHDYNIPYVNALDKWLIYRSGRKVGKTMSTAVKAIHFAWYAPFMNMEAIKDRCDILIVAPTQSQADIMLDQIKTFVHRSAIVSDYVVKEKSDEIWIKFVNEEGISKIYTRAAGERGDSIRGYIPHVIVVDEASFIKRRVLVSLIPAGMATDARVWLTSTPFGDIGYFHEACMNARAGNNVCVEQGFNNPKGRWLQFSVSSLANPAIAKNPDMLEELKMLTKDEYKQEVLGEFSSIGDALIQRNLIEAAYGDFTLPKYVRYFMGVDVARTGKDETVIVVIAVDDHENVYLVDCKAYEGTTSLDVVGYTREMYQRWKEVETIYMDETGVGGGSVDIGKDQNLPIRGVFFSLQENDPMYRTIQILFENGRIKLGGKDYSSKMAYQLSYLKKKFSSQKYMQVESEEHKDYPSALALACRAVAGGENWNVLPSIDEIL